MITEIHLRVWMRPRDFPDQDTWSIIYWQKGKETPGMRTALLNPVRDQNDLMWKAKGFRVVSHAYNPVDIPENERAKYFSLDGI